MAPGAEADTLRAESLSLAYGERLVVNNLSLTLPPAKVTVIVGANASGKSTLLRGLARLLRPRTGAVYLDGESIARMSARQLAVKVGILAQSPAATPGLTVASLVAYGRYPHQRWFQQWSPEDEQAVNEALTTTKMLDFADRPLDELSGGQRQRAWIAMALAQDTGIMLLDEPTTFLDMAHQIEVLDLLIDLNRTRGRTIALVLHDLNQASRYGHHLVAMADGRIVAEGKPGDIITPDLVGAIFDVDCQIILDPVSGTPLVIPISARSADDSKQTSQPQSRP